MKFFAIFLGLFLIAFPAAAQTNVSKEDANKYFASCIGQQPSQQLSKDSQNMLCACTAARLTQFFTMSDMQAMMNTNPAIARPAYNKMMVDIYAPCMETPTREFHYNACITNPQTSSYGNPQQICACMADAVANHMKVNGPAVFRDLLTANPNLTDPMAALTDDPSFQNFAQSKLLGCLK